jgi:uncharacterized protein with HEPN domain
LGYISLRKLWLYEGKREFLDYLSDIFDTIEKIESFTQDISFEAFAEDEMRVFAVVRALEIIGEAAKNVPMDLKEKYPSVPWKEMAGTRDKLIHLYFGVNLNVVWKTVVKDLPPLKEQIAEILRESGK